MDRPAPSAQPGDVLRRKAEEHLAAKPEVFRSVTADAPQSLIYELQVHQIELEMQNEHLRETQLELEKSRDKYYQLYDLAPVGYFTIGENGLIEEVNLAGAGLVGLDRSQLINQAFSRFLTKDGQDTWYFHRKRVIDTGTRQQTELAFQRKDGSVFFARADSIVANDDAGQGNQLKTIISDITELKKEIQERRRAEEVIRRSLAEKEILLREIHHRVKNNLQIVAGLLEISKSKTQNQDMIDLFNEAHSRIHTMALIHSQLYQSECFDRIDMGRHLDQLVGYLLSTYGAKENHIRVLVEPSDVQLTLTQAIPCTLILNEVIVNALKHAFKDKQGGSITVSLTKAIDDLVRMTVKDDGVGLPISPEAEKPVSFGWEMISRLTAQLKGTIKVNQGQGTEVVVEFQAGPYEDINDLISNHPV
ncbi:MAG: PAS domain S-box protein [Deltaproteobacteria bacterium]|nr:PAS domain S-box protein [Deltaproteobacteria bacterium]